MPLIKLFSRFFRNTQQRRLLVSIGAGINQMPLIKEAQKAGFRVIGVDISISSPGLMLSDLKIQESVTNQDEIYNRIQELLVDGIIVGALTRSFGSAVKTTAFINDRLNVPFIALSRVDDLLEKKKMKAVFHKAGIPSPKYKLFDEKKDTEGFPFILKPSKGHAKTGVQLIRGSADLSSYLADMPKDGHFLKEEFIGGDEIIAAGIASCGKFYLTEITDKVMSDHPFFVDIRHQTPSKYSERWTEIEQLGQSIVDAFEIATSPLFIEIRFDGDGKPFVIEAVPDFGGEFLADILIPEHTGYPFITGCIAALAREGFTAPSRKKSRGAVIVQYITGTDGILTSHNPVPKAGENGLVFCRIFKEIGSAVKKPETNHDRIGVVVMKGKTIQEAISAAEAVIEQLNIIIKPAKKQTS